MKAKILCAIRDNGDGSASVSMNFPDIKRGMILELLDSFELFKDATTPISFDTLFFGDKVIALSVPTQELNFNSLKILYKNKIGYISWSLGAVAKIRKI